MNAEGAMAGEGNAEMDKAAPLFIMFKSAERIELLGFKYVIISPIFTKAIFLFQPKMNLNKMI